jgi:mannitol/fructose-specific phosphotransferase system IIA component (Ntr-type)
MRLMDLLSEELICIPLSGSSRDAVIAELVDLLVSQGAIRSESREKVLTAVTQREESQSTGLGSAVAIPHGLCEDVDEVVAALGIHPDGVEFGAIDGLPVRLVILLVVPPNMFQAHVRTLAGIARVLNDASLRELLLEARRPETVLEILVQREERAFLN